MLNVKSSTLSQIYQALCISPLAGTIDMTIDHDSVQGRPQPSLTHSYPRQLKLRRKDEWNRIKGPDINVYVYG